jgi:hypothetical protein
MNYVNYDKHIYLYAKHHYVRNNIIEDLKIIYGKRNGIDPEHMQVRDIISCILNLTIKHIKIERNSFLEFLSDIDPAFCWRIGAETQRINNQHIHTHDSYCEAIIRKCLSILSLTRVDEIEGGLSEEADASLLPVTEEAKNFIQKHLNVN